MNIREQIQIKGRDVFLQNGNGILNIAQRLGKIRISIMILEALNKKKNILISYPDNRIQQSWIDDFRFWGFDYSGVVFTNNSSLFKYTEQKWEFFIMDEIHTLSDNQIEQAALICKNSKNVLGLSGTISLDTEMQIRAILGLNILMKYSVEEAIKDGIIADYKIFIHKVNLDNIIKTKNKKGKLVSEKQQYDAYSYVIEQIKYSGRDPGFLLLNRNRVLQNSISKHKKALSLLKELKGKRILVFTGTKKASESLGIPFFHSSSKDPDIFDNFKAGKIDEIALVDMGKSGVTFKNLDCIIVQSFTGNEETTEQLLSRALVKDSDEKIADIHFIVSTELAELRKLNKTLINIPKEKIIYV